ncbi:MAG: alpha/beta hydrolase family protein [Colwellia sp.]|nr:alpha/beta hydrolase family protein [Colwellia sp.]MCW8866630.1 alpha/beta hydrolase family protein [Colwellia sp.]MCW9082860.1 alpha/beta hydrolase family protein [Colwellia sp.]
MQTSFKLSITLLMVIFSSFFAFAAQNDNNDKTPAANSKTEAVPLPVSRTQQYKEDLKHYLPSSKVKPILVGTQEYITLVNENTSPNNRGVAILIPDWQQGAVNPKAVNFLRQSLPEQGWTTISIQPNKKPDDFPSTALKLATQIEENKTRKANYKRDFSALINAVSDKAKTYPGIVIMIVQGNHGSILIELLNSNEILHTPNAIVLLSSYVFTGEKLLDEDNNNFAKALANSEPPVLDLFLKHDNAIVIDKAPQRLALAKQEMKVYYRQRQLNNTRMGFYPEQALLTQINSWLKSIGW